MRIFLERLEAKRICQALTVTLLYLSRAPSALRNPFLSSPSLARLFLFSNFPRVLNTCILEMENISLLYLAQDAHFRNEEWNPFAYLYVIRVEFSARQAVEGAEVQATREDSIRTAALPATKTCQCQLNLIPFQFYLPSDSPVIRLSNQDTNNEIRRKFSRIIRRNNERRHASLSNNNTFVSII